MNGINYFVVLTFYFLNFIFIFTYCERYQNTGFVSVLLLILHFGNLHIERQILEAQFTNRKIFNYLIVFA